MSNLKLLLRKVKLAAAKPTQWRGRGHSPHRIKADGILAGL